MIERLFKNWRTSLVGLVLFASSMGAVYAGKAKLGEVALFLTASITFFFLKDGKSKE